MSKPELEPERTDFDGWLADMVRRHGKFTALVILTGIGERSVVPLCSTYMHIVGEEVDWTEIKALFAARSPCPHAWAPRARHSPASWSPPTRRSSAGRDCSTRTPSVQAGC